MTRFSNAARHTLISALTAFALSAALPQMALAAGSDGIWKIDAAKSNFSSGSATLSLRRVTQPTPGAGGFIVVNRGNVYLVTGATAYDSRDIQKVDYDLMATQGTAKLIGTAARSRDVCGFRCQSGLPESKITLSFKPVAGNGPHINEMLAKR
jgi:hypothetical protein